MASDYSPDEARRHLDANGAMEGPCPVCGKVEWRISDALSGIPLVNADDVLDISESARVVPVVCINCGFVRFHDWNTLSD
jgi:predicted RNA-binding Zn-ribbon protein involved in translation (DUF1610 family)